MTNETVSRLKGGLTKTRTPRTYTNSTNRARSERIELDGREQFFELRSLWSAWLICWICALLLFQFGLAIAVGAGCLDFREYQWFLPLVVAQNFAQIAGMGYIIVRFLYPPETGRSAAADAEADEESEE